MLWFINSFPRRSLLWKMCMWYQIYSKGKKKSMRNKASAVFSLWLLDSGSDGDPSNMVSCKQMWKVLAHEGTLWLQNLFVTGENRRPIDVNQINTKKWKSSPKQSYKNYLNTHLHSRLVITLLWNVYFLVCNWLELLCEFQTCKHLQPDSGDVKCWLKHQGLFLRKSHLLHISKHH